jgi:hypothetical protein
MCARGLRAQGARLARASANKFIKKIKIKIKICARAACGSACLKGWFSLLRRRCWAVPVPSAMTVAVAYAWARIVGLQGLPQRWCAWGAASRKSVRCAWRRSTGVVFSIRCAWWRHAKRRLAVWVRWQRSTGLMHCALVVCFVLNVCNGLHYSFRQCGRWHVASWCGMAVRVTCLCLARNWRSRARARAAGGRRRTCLRVMRASGGI